MVWKTLKYEPFKTEITPRNAQIWEKQLSLLLLKKISMISSVETVYIWMKRYVTLTSFWTSRRVCFSSKGIEKNETMITKKTSLNMLHWRQINLRSVHSLRLLRYTSNDYFSGIGVSVSGMNHIHNRKFCPKSKVELTQTKQLIVQYWVIIIYINLPYFRLNGARSYWFLFCLQCFIRMLPIQSFNTQFHSSF